jgi:hypothetical protein
VGINDFNTSSCLILFFCLSDVRVVADFELEPDDMLDGVPPVASSISLPFRGALVLSRQRFTRAYSARSVHVAFVEFIASLTGTFHLITYSSDDGLASLKKKTQKKNKNITTRHTKLKALSFGSLRSKSFNGRSHA